MKTVPDRAFFLILRLYSPTEPFFNQRTAQVRQSHRLSRERNFAAVQNVATGLSRHLLMSWSGGRFRGEADKRTNLLLATLLTVQPLTRPN
jgi:hypothetical protein